MLLKIDRVPVREWDGAADRHRQESPGENEEKGVDDENGDWDKIVWASIPSQGSIELRSNNRKSRHV